MYKKYTQGTGMPQRLYRKIWRIMRLTTILVLATLLQVSAATRAQNVTLQETGASLKSIFADIKAQTGYIVLYPTALVKNAKPVTVSISNMPLKEAMQRILENQDIEFEIQDNSIILRQKETNFLDRLKAVFTRIDVHGKVVDEKGLPLPGATVKVKDGSQAVTTDKDGIFQLRKVDDKAVIVISSIGYISKEQNAGADMGTIVLLLSTSKLDEVQVMAYGLTSRRLSTSDISTVKSADIERQPVINPLQAMQGRVAGVEIVQQTGVPGSAFTVLIRGQNSIANGSEPLYVIDGVPYQTDLLLTQGQNLLGGDPEGTAGSTLNYLNIGDIESIDVLKDAGATAIYGSRGANGVVLITTKKGKAGPMAVNLNVSSGINKVTRRVDMMNTQQYLQMRREAFKNDNLTMKNTNAYDVLLYDSTRYTDWQKKLIGNTGKFSNVQLGISGGNSSTQYNVGAVYNRQTTVFPANYYDERKGVNFNLGSTSADSRFHMSVTGSYLLDNSNMSDIDLTRYIFLPPNAPDMVKPDGSLNYTNVPTNYVSGLRRVYNRSVNNLVSSGVLSYQLLQGLEIMTNLGYTNISLGEVTAVPGSSINPAYLAFLPRSSAFTDNRSSSWIAEPQLHYTKELGSHHLAALAGMSFQSNSSTGQILSGSGYTSDNQIYNIQSAPSLTVSNQATAYRYSAIFGRLSYNFADKYLINLSGRRDGSSRFGPDRRFSNFGSAELGWIFTKEDFIKVGLPWLSFGKLRGSYGLTGNDRISDYRYMTLYSTYFTAYQNVKGLSLDNLANPDLAWEKTNKLEMALDLGFLKDRLLLTVNFYRNRSSSQLLQYPLSTVTGFEAIDKNFGATVQNKGWEFIATTRNVSNAHFTWTSSANISFQRNKLLAFPDLGSSSYAGQLIIGKPISIGRYYSFAGVNPATGIYQFYAADGSKTTTPSFLTDRTYLFDHTPKYAGGLSNDLTYRHFDLDFTFQFVKQMGWMLPLAPRPGTIGSNQLASVQSRWQHPGDITDIQRYSAKGASDAYFAYLTYEGSSAIITDASFIRLKNLSLGYTLPEELTRHLGIKKARLSIQGQNLLTFTPYKGLDPENQSLGNLPPLFTLTGGLQVTF